MGKYSGSYQGNIFHNGTNGIDVQLNFERRGFNSRLTATFSGGCVFNQMEVELVRTQWGTVRGPSLPQDPEAHKEMGDKLGEALNEAFIAFTAKRREINGTIEGAPLHTQPEWEEIELMQIAVEKMSDSLHQPLRQPRQANGLGVFARVKAAFLAR